METPRQIQQPRSRNTLQRTLGLLSDDLMNQQRIDMYCPRDRGGSMRPGPTLHAWGPFLLFAWATLLNWTATFALGASWEEYGHRYYFSVCFFGALVVQTIQGIHLAELLESSETAVSMQCTDHLRQLAGVLAAWFGLAPAVLAYSTLRSGIDSNTFAAIYLQVSFRGLAWNSLPLCLVFVFVGVQEAWLDHTDPRFSGVLALTVFSTLIAASATVFSWEAVSRNQRSTEIFFDTSLSIYGVLTIVAGALRLGALLGWVVMLPCVGRYLLR